MIAYLVPLLLLVATTAQAQSITLTNADLGKRHDVVVPVSGDVLTGLKARAYRAPMNYPEPRTFDASPLRRSSGGPWEFLPSALPRRLDGSLWTEPRAVHGLPPWFYNVGTTPTPPRHREARGSRRHTSAR